MNGKKGRHNKLKKIINGNPFLTDDEIAEILNVSVPTIRLDRLELGIPELRQRIKDVASDNLSKVKTLQVGEVIGELVDITLGEKAISILETTDDMVFEESKIVRGHYIYALAESLAIAVIDAKVALVGVANIKYKVPIHTGARLVSKAEVIRKKDRSFQVWVKIFLKDKEVFRGKFILVSY